MRLFDSHCHIDDPSYQQDLDAVFSRMDDAGVCAAMVAGVTLKTCRRAVAIADASPICFAAVGIHPHDASSASDAVLDELFRMANHPRVKAWGEAGLDFNRMFSPADVQETVLVRQLELADAAGLPLIFHERDSNGRFLSILKAHARPERGGVVHCFSGNKAELFAYLDLGYHIGITGILTLLKRGQLLRELVPLIPADRILIETDSPYLTPAPEKNKHRRNEPAFVRSVMLKLADVRGADADALAEQVWNNTCRLYKIDESEIGKNEKKRL
ncbi:MAG: hydrolase TatD [Deltaproteobacteria bacterium]|nr:MAG: hydrolase TatD [Deltaproteobacteria bacterium]